MKKQIVYWFGLAVVLSLLMAACGGTTPTPQSEGSKTAESVVTEQPAATEEETVPTDSVTPNSTAEIAADFTLPDSNGNMVNLVDELQENEQVVLVFYYGSSCKPCMAQLSEIENDRARYEEKGAQVIAIAVQGERGAERSAKVSDAQFPILADSDHAVAEAYGVDEDDGSSTPSVFIVNKDRQIIWKEISHIEGSGCGKDRIPSQTILENLG
ncbi:MAG: peroxiredoxin family protein [Anaerolineales bacterium]|nr:peroxiredoxin family protein [Anaerolineales bacterium]